MHETPAEPSGSPLNARIKIAGYPVQQMAGLLWAYLGPSPAPLLPRYEHLVRDDWEWDVGISRLPCNWLQWRRTRSIAAHRVPAHEVHELGAQLKGFAAGSGAPSRRIDFEVKEYGVVKSADVGRRHRGPGKSGTSVTRSCCPARRSCRIPRSGCSTRSASRSTTPTRSITGTMPEREAGKAPRARAPIWDNPWQTPDGSYMPEVLNAQDMMVMARRGRSPTTLENLGECDRGVALYRRTLLEQVERSNAARTRWASCAIREEHALDRDPGRETPRLRPHRRARIGDVHLPRTRGGRAPLP